MGKCILCGKKTSVMAARFFLLNTYGTPTQNEICPDCNLRLVQNNQQIRYDAKLGKVRYYHAKTMKEIFPDQPVPANEANQNGNTQQKPNNKKGWINLMKILIPLIAVPLLIMLVIFFTGPQCNYQEKISTYSKRQCTNHTGYQRLPYCKDHMYLKILPANMCKAIDTWDYDLMKETFAEAEKHDFSITVDWNVEKKVDATGAVHCRYPSCELYIPQDHRFCPDHQYAQQMMDDFRAALIDYDIQNVNKLHEEYEAKGFLITGLDDCVKEGVDMMINDFLINHEQANVTDLMLRLHHLSSLLHRFNLEPDAFDKLSFLIRTQAIDLKTMDPSLGFYAGKKNSSYSSSDGLLSSSGGRTYGYNYMTSRRSSSAAALNNGPTIESSSSVYYKDISIGDSLGRGIWAIETPAFDIVVLSNESIDFIDNSKMEIAYRLGISEYERDKAVVKPVQKITAKDGTEAWFLTSNSYPFYDNLLVTLDADGAIASVTSTLSTETYGAFLNQFIGRKGPFVEDVNATLIPDVTYECKAIIKTLNELYGGEAAAQAIRDDIEAAARAKAEAAEKAERDKIRTATVKGMVSDVTVTVTVENGVIAAITVDASDETPTFGTRCGTDEAFLNQFIGKTLPVDNVDVLTGATITSNAVIEAVNSLAK